MLKRTRYNEELSSPVEVIKETYAPNMEQINTKGKNYSDEQVAGEDIIYPIQKENIKPDKTYTGIEYNSNKWIEKACSVALESVKNGGGPFGAILIQIDDETNEVLRYWPANNQVTEAADPTAHAEVMAIRSGCKSLGVFNLGSIDKEMSRLPQTGKTSHCEIYSSCEPCPMCYSSIFWARIPSLYFAATQFDAAVPGVNFSDEEIYNELKAPYVDRKTRVYQCSAPNSLDAFNLWKNIEKEVY